MNFFTKIRVVFSTSYIIKGYGFCLLETIIFNNLREVVSSITLKLLILVLKNEILGACPQLSIQKSRLAEGQLDRRKTRSLAAV